MNSGRVLVMISPPYAYVKCTRCGCEATLDAPDPSACYDIMTQWAGSHECPRFQVIAEAFGARLLAN